MIQIEKSGTLSRRRFLTGCAACGFCMKSTVAAAPAEARVTGKTKIRLFFTHPDPKIQGWPYQGYDYEGRKATLNAKLRSECPNVEFVSAEVSTAAAARQVYETQPEADAQMVYMLGIPAEANPVLVNSGRPTILVDDLYGGTGSFLGLYADARRRGLPVAGVASSEFRDVVVAVNAVACMTRLRSSVILDVLDRNLSPAERAIRDTVGPEIRRVTAEELNAAYLRADTREAKRWAKTWIDGAAQVIEPTAAEIERSGAMYVAMLDLMRQHGAQGIAVDCLRLFYGGKMSAYPCLGFFQLNNDGLVGACEADVQSAATMLMLSYLVGKPGYISDPVIDTARNQVIYAHCVAPTKVYGPKGAANPYHIRSHSEDRKGASIRSIMPVGETVTTLKLIPGEKSVVIHKARTTGNIDEDKACRTKLAADVKDARKLAAEWRWGWHRVTVYGDATVPVDTLSALMGFKVVEEG